MLETRKEILQEIENCSYLAGTLEYDHQQSTKAALLEKVRVYKEFLLEFDTKDKGTFFLCSEPVIDFYKPTFVSKPFKSGYKSEKKEKYYIALINSFEDIEAWYNNLEKSEENWINVWCQELVPGLMDVSKFTLAGLKRNGVFVEIENKLGLTTEKNIAMTLYNLSEKFNCTPIELIDKIIC